MANEMQKAGVPTVSDGIRNSARGTRSACGMRLGIARFGVIVFFAISALSASAQQAAPSAGDAPTAAATANKAKEVWYVQSVAQSELTGYQSGHYWSHGTKFRFETVIDGHPIVNIVNGSNYYALDLFSGVGIAIERSAKAVAQDRLVPRPFGNDHIQLLNEGGELIREEVLFGKPCKVYRLTNDRGRREVWVDKKLDLPIRAITFQRDTAAETVTDYIGWARDNRDVPDSFFTPDPRLKLVDIRYDGFARYADEGTVVPVLFPYLIHGR